MKRKTIAPRTMVITGADTGIGLALAGTMPEHSHLVVEMHIG